MVLIPNLLNKADLKIRFKRYIKIFRSILILSLAWIVIRFFIAEIYLVPTNSMEGAILTGELILVTKWQYGPRLYSSFSFQEGFRYNRLGKLKNIKHNDVIVFNSPYADTVLCDFPLENYYTFKTKFKAKQEIAYQPVSKRVPLVKRCIAAAGDTLYIKNNIIYINCIPTIKDLPVLKEEILKKLNLQQKHYSLDLSPMEGFVKYKRQAKTFLSIFPNNSLYHWKNFNFGPLIIPKKGMTVTLNYLNIHLYRRIIETYEHNKLTITKWGIYINSQKSKSYTFKMNYFFMMGDNRNESYDSRYWGFVPEDHIIGKVKLILFSRDETMIRWDRMYKAVK